MIYKSKMDIDLLKEKDMLDYRVETFLVVCQEMNFTKAAKRLNITQPAVSKHIRQLEEYYDTLLFGYEGKKIYLTKEGKMLYEAMVSMHNNEIYLMEQLKQSKEEREEFHFGVTLTIGEFMISDSLERYIMRHPNANIHMNVANTRELIGQLEAGLIDFAILEGNFQKMNYENILYAVESFVPVCSPFHSLAGKTVNLTDILGERIIIRENGSGTREIFENALEERNIKLSDFAGVVEIANMNAIKDLVLKNCGISFMYEKAVERELRDGELKKINIRGWSIQHEMCAVWKKDNLFGDYYERLLRELLEI